MFRIDQVPYFNVFSVKLSVIFTSLYVFIKLLEINWNKSKSCGWDAMSLRYADTSLPDLLSRQSLSYSSNEHAQYIKMCLCNKGVFLNLCFTKKLIQIKKMRLSKLRICNCMKSFYCRTTFLIIRQLYKFKYDICKPSLGC